MPGNSLVNKTRPPSPASPTASDHGAAKPIPDNTAQDETDLPVKKGVDDKEAAQYANKMLSTISSTLVKHDTDVASWDLPSLANFVDTLMRASNAY